jgi:hypothetical protein
VLHREGVGLLQRRALDGRGELAPPADHQIIDGTGGLMLDTGPDFGLPRVSDFEKKDQGARHQQLDFWLPADLLPQRRQAGVEIRIIEPQAAEFRFCSTDAPEQADATVVKFEREVQGHSRQSGTIMCPPAGSDSTETT